MRTLSLDRDSLKYLRPGRALLGALLAASIGAATTPQASAQPREATGSRGRLSANVERVDSMAGITEYRLKTNGMNVLLVPNRSVPVVTFLVVYHVGSRNEWPGATGSAHLLEHLLFNKSTKNYGKANGKKTIQEVLYAAGADFGSSNMTTWNDRMTGYSTLPSDKLELAMKIEADRLGRALLLDSERQPEMSVVRNEYEIGENNPYGALDKAVVGASVTAHPYHWDTIGYRSDIEGVSTETLREHYRRFFHPDNATAVIVGDFDDDAALRLFEREFGVFPRSKAPIPKVITVEPPQEGERRVIVRRPGTFGVVQIAYLRPGSLHPDFLPLELLQVILSSGVNSRLYQGLVETRLASDVDAWNYTLHDPYPFSVQATVAPGSTHEKAEAALKAALASVARDGVTADELERAKKQVEVATVRRRDGTYEMASALGEAVASADWKWFVKYLDGIKSVTADDVKRVAATYFTPDKATVGWFVPIGGEAAAPPVKEPAKPAAKSKSKKSGAGGASEPGEGASFAARTLRVELPNGLVVQVLANRSVPTVAIHGIVRSGRIHAPADQPALPGLVAKMLTRGAAGRTKSEIAARLDDAGARLTIGSDLLETSIVGSGMARDLKLLLQTLSDDLLRPTFGADELAKAKEEYRAEILKADDNTQQRAADRLSRLVYPAGHPYAAPTKEGWLSSIDAGSVADLRAYHARRFVGTGTILSIVGDVDPKETIALVTSLFGAMPRGERPVVAPPRAEAGAAREVVETMPGKANTNFFLGHAGGLARGDSDYEACMIANAALGQSGLTSRVGKRVRDTEGLSYSIVSRFFWIDDIDGAWAVIAAVAPQNAAKAIRSSREVVEQYVRDGITAEEVESQKSFFAGNFQVRLGTNAGVAAQLTYAEKFGFGPKYLDDYPARFRAVTLGQVNEAIRKHIHPDRMILVVAGDHKEVPK
ncbi:MAG TPA: pitrilysin family protein [Candidatus Eisenbacteria bacterium]|nr:pitrilysin family protein [Candidatus Eisenbacteria bacterium]